MTPKFIVQLSIGTILNVIFAWFFSIKGGRYHGIYRIFSFESILLLLLFCSPVWFANPWKWNQLISWTLLIGSIPPVVYGTLMLMRRGRPEGHLENTTVLVESGLYRYIRHPLYGSLALFGSGVFFKNITIATGVCAMVNLCAVFATAKTEEGEMLKKFGDEYARYMTRTKMFIPFIV